MLRLLLACFSTNSCKISPVEEVKVLDTSASLQPSLIHGITVTEYWFWCAKVGSSYTLEDILPTITNINEVDDQGNTALHLAAQHNHIKSIKVLLEGGCNPNICNKLGYKPKELLKTEADSKTIFVGNDAQKLISAQYSRPDYFTDWDINNGVEAAKLFELYEAKLTGSSLDIIEL
jgi:ankyrin repeat protein